MQETHTHTHTHKHAHTHTPAQQAVEAAADDRTQDASSEPVTRELQPVSTCECVIVYACVCACSISIRVHRGVVVIKFLKLEGGASKV